MPTKTLTVAIRIPAMTNDADQRDQMEAIQRSFYHFLVRRRGPSTAIIWKRKMDKFMKTNSYDSIRTKLEEDINLEIQLTTNDLQQIVTP